MRTRYDQFGKQMVRCALPARGPVETDAEVPADTRRVDLWFMPDATRAPDQIDLGLLGRITEGPCALELFHCTPDGDELAGCLIKHGNFRHFLSLRKVPPPPPDAGSERWRCRFCQSCGWRSPRTPPSGRATTRSF